MATDGISMRAVVHRRYGAPALLEIEEIARPELTDGGVLVRVRATSVNPVESHTITGEPLIARFGAGLRRPEERRLRRRLRGDGRGGRQGRHGLRAGRRGLRRANRGVRRLGKAVRTVAASIPGRRKAIFFITKIDRDDLAFVRQLLEDGKVTPVIDRRYDLDDIRDALAYLGEGHAQGKVVVTV